MFRYIYFLTLLMALLSACSNDDLSPPEIVVPDGEQSTLAKGADISWATKMESEGEKFYSSDGVQKECTALMKLIGMNSVRYRVWVNPSDGWNNKADVLVKAKRAQALGMKIMIDFHYSDTWADPGHQNPPALWTAYGLAELKSAMADHTVDVLSTLKANGVDIEWVQVGNETPVGMMLPVGEINAANSNFAELVNSGYDAVKSVYPDAEVIVHVDQGDVYGRLAYVFDYLEAKGGRYDMIGVSLYPTVDDWQSKAQLLIANIKSLAISYNKPTMVCEIGMIHSEPEVCNELLTYIMTEGQKSTNNNYKGIFYWEPQAPAGYNGGYDKGAFKDGKPTSALDAFL